MRSTLRRPILTTLSLVGAMALFAGCGGDPGAHLPASMSGSSGANATAETGMLDSVFGGDPGPSTAGVSSMVDDPVLADYDGVDTLDGIDTSDAFTQAVSDWNDNEGSASVMTSNLDDLGLDDPWPVDGDRFGGYGAGSGSGFDSGLNLSMASFGGNDFGGVGFGGVGAMDAGFMDPGLDDGGIDAGFDPGFDAGFDPGMDVGGFDPGLDVGSFDAGVDVGGFDAGVDVGFDPGFDPGFGF